MTTALRCSFLVLLGLGCVDEAGPDGGRARQESVLPVIWRSLVNVAASGNDLTKSGSTNDWDAGAVSNQRLFTDGYVEFTTGERSTAKVAGLSNGNGGQSYEDIDFAIHLQAGGGIRVREGGALRGGDLGSYQAGDVFRVQVAGGVVTYWKNGILLYTSAGTPDFPLRVDTSLRTPGATLNDVVVEPTPFWQAAVRVAADGADLVKVDSGGLWNAGASSIAALSGDGYAEFTTGESTTAKMAGLSSGDGGPAHADIDFAIYLTASGTVGVREGGQARGNFGRYAAGDVFRVAATGGVVTYARNGTVFYTSAATPGSPLLLDTSLRSPAATILGAQLVSTAGIATFDNSSGTFVWDPSCDCPVDYIEGNSLDIARSAAQQTGIPADGGLEFFKRSPAVGMVTPGGFWIRGWRMVVNEPAGAVLAADESFVIDGNDPLEVVPPLVKNPGDVVGRADLWKESEFPTGRGVQTAHFRDVTGETGPDQVWFMSGILAVRFTAADGPHYGFVELAWVENSGGFTSDYAPVRWGYNPQPGVGLVIP